MLFEKALLLLPTYNEAENIPSILERIFPNLMGAHVLVIDDNSPDGTGKIIEEKAKSCSWLHLLSREKKEGLGRAYVAGMKWGMDRGYHFFIEMDADHSHAPEDLPRFLQGLKTHPVVVGCRYMQGGKILGWTWLRQGISRGGNLYARTILELPYLDLTGGFNGWRKEVLEKIDYQSINSKGYAFQIELKYRAHCAGFKIEEIPIQFDDRRHGVSKMSGSIVLEAMAQVWKIRWRVGRTDEQRSKGASRT